MLDVPVEVPEVYVVHPEPLKGLVDRLRDVLGVAADRAVRNARSAAELRGEEDVVPLARSLEPCGNRQAPSAGRLEPQEYAPLAEDHLAVAVRVGGVPEVAPARMRGVEELGPYRRGQQESM